MPILIKSRIMKPILNFSLLLLLMLFSSFQPGERVDYYQLRFYWFDNKEQEAMLDHYFEYALLPALHRAGIERVGVFKPVEGKNEEQQFMVLFIPMRSLDEFEQLPRILSSDDTYQEDGLNYIRAEHDQPPYRRIETILLRAFSGSPQLGEPVKEGVKGDRIYELRSYESATELLHERKVEMFNQGEIALFLKLGFNPLFFGDVLSSSHMPHLMYMTTFADAHAQEEHWNAFRDDPDWLAMKDLEKYLNTVSHITSYLLHPLPYSDL
jgi:hypothetical protein